ncbi:MAG: ABC transporter permease [Candidatus Heimdallarchaeota archaeon]
MKKDSNIENTEEPSKEVIKDTSTNGNGSRLLDKLNDAPKYFLNVGKTLLPFLVIFALLEVLLLILHATIPDLSHNLYPIPHDIIIYTWKAFFPGKDSAATSVFIQISWSFARVLLGFVIGTLGGLIIGILMSLSKWLYRLLNPIFSLSISIPTLAWVPILLIIFGLNARTIIVTIVLSCFFPIVYSTTNGIRSIDKNLIWAARIMGASNLEIFFDVLLPGSLVSVITGLRLAIGYSWRAIVGAEMLVALTDNIGIGYYIVGGQIANQIPQVIIGVFLIALGGLLLDTALMRPLELVTIRRWGMIEKTKQ